MKDLTSRIYDKYGINAMREKWIEELLELATVLQQSKQHGKITDEQIISEIADVSFVIEQMTEIYDSEQIQSALIEKKKRTESRLFNQDIF